MRGTMKTCALLTVTVVTVLAMNAQAITPSCVSVEEHHLAKRNLYRLNAEISDVKAKTTATTEDMDDFAEAAEKGKTHQGCPKCPKCPKRNLRHLLGNQMCVSPLTYRKHLALLKEIEIAKDKLKKVKSEYNGVRSDFHSAKKAYCLCDPCHETTLAPAVPTPPTTAPTPTAAPWAWALENDIALPGLVASVAYGNRKSGAELAVACFNGDGEDPREGVLYVYDAQGLISTLPSGSNNPQAVVYSQDGNLLAFTGDDMYNSNPDYGGDYAYYDQDGAPYEVKVFDRDIGAVTYKHDEHEEKVVSLAFSPDGALLASGSKDGSVKLFSLLENKVLHTLTGHTATVQSVAFSPDGAQVASAGYWDNTVNVWSATYGTLLRTLGHTKSVLAVVYTPDGLHLLSGSGDGNIRVWSATSTETKPLQTLTGHTDIVTDLAVSHDGAFLASASYDNTVRLWNARAGWAAVRTLEGHTDVVRTVAFSPDGTQLASGSGSSYSNDKVASWHNGTIKVWNVPV